MNRVVAKAVVIHDGKLLILRRSKTDTRRPLEWDLAGGAVDDGETIEAAGIREVKEEAGLDVSLTAADLLYGHTEYFDDHGNVTWLIFKTRSESDEVTLSYEHDQYAWVTVDEALQKVTYERQNRFLRHIADHGLLK